MAKVGELVNYHQNPNHEPIFHDTMVHVARVVEITTDSVTLVLLHPDTGEEVLPVKNVMHKALAEDGMHHWVEQPKVKKVK